jgi:indolepyruvate ferredoxin oxidoreductase
MRAIELNNVAVPMNKLAFAIGRLAAADLNALDMLRKTAQVPRVEMAAMPLPALISDRERRLAEYGGTKYVERYRKLVNAAAASKNDAITRAVATTFYKLLAVKDEYEVARLHADPAFRAALEAQFEGTAGQDFTVKFNLAPPALSKAEHGGVPRKKVFGQWLWPVLGTMAKFRGLRGGLFDPFGKTLERRMERQLAGDYETTMTRALGSLTADNAKNVEALAALYERVRGYGHVKLANLSMVKRRERDLAAALRIEAATGAAVRASLDEMKGAASLKGIPVVVAK